MKKISIITINYNNFKGLKRTVESVIHQTWKDFEYIIIDGGSTDGSAEYIFEMQKQFNYWVSEPDRGIYHAMNKGIEKASGEYILFLNSGDWLNDMIDLNDIANKLTGVCIYFIDSYGIRNSQFYRMIYTPTNITLRQFYISSVPHSGSSFIHSSLFTKIGYYDYINYKYYSDWLWFLKAFIEGVPFVKIEKIILSNYEWNGRSFSDAARAERLELLNRYHYLFSDSKDLVALNKKFKFFIKLLRYLRLNS